MRLDVGHERAARLAQAHEDLERLALVVLGDGDVERAERRLDPAGGAPQQLGPRALLAPLQVLGLEIVHHAPQAVVLGLELGELALSSDGGQRGPVARGGRDAGELREIGPRLGPAARGACSCTFLAVEPVESTCMSRLPSR